jgi:hypothetical protein
MARLEEGRHVFDQVTSRKSFQEFSVGHEDCHATEPELWKQTVRRFLKEDAGLL